MASEAYDDWIPTPKTTRKKKAKEAFRQHSALGEPLSTAKIEWLWKQFDELRSTVDDPWNALVEQLAGDEERASLGGGYLGFARRQIQRAWSEQSPREALRTIGNCWAELDEVTSLAEARTRLILRKVERPLLAPLPAELQEALASLDPASVHREVVEAAALSIRAALHALDQAPTEISVDSATRGKVEVSWVFSQTVVRWVLAPSELRWPGVRVKVYVPSSSDSARLVSRRFYNAIDLIDDLCTLARA